MNVKMELLLRERRILQAFEPRKKSLLDDDRKPLKFAYYPTWEGGGIDVNIIRRKNVYKQLQPVPNIGVKIKQRAIPTASTR